MTSVWRKHLIICLVFGLLAIPIYFLDRALLGGGGGGNWITLDFRGLIFWTYITLAAIHVTLSSIAVLLFPKTGVLRIHLGSMVLAVVLLITGVAVYGKMRRLAISNEHRAFMASRRPLMNVIELKPYPWLKTKLYVLGGCLLKSKSPYRDIYDEYKHRIQTMQQHEGKSKRQIHAMAIWYMQKMFLRDLYNSWRPLESLAVAPT